MSPTMTWFSEFFLTTTTRIITDLLSKQFNTLSWMKCPIFLPNILLNLLQYLLCPLQNNQEGRIWEGSRLFSLYMVRYSDNCRTFETSSAFSIPSPLPLPCDHPVPLFLGLQAFPLSLQDLGLGGPKVLAIGSLTLPQHLDEQHRSAFSSTMPGILAKGPWQIQFQAASRHLLCTLFYLCLALCALE